MSDLVITGEICGFGLNLWVWCWILDGHSMLELSAVDASEFVFSSSLLISCCISKSGRGKHDF